MGTNIEVNKLIDERNAILDLIFADTQNWDKSLDSGLEIIERNQERIKRISDINDSLIIEGIDIFENEYNQKIKAIFNELTILNNVIKDERKKIIKEKIALCKRDDLIDSYITNTQESIFIDKDV